MSAPGDDSRSEHGSVPDAAPAAAAPSAPAPVKQASRAAVIVGASVSIAVQALLCIIGIWFLVTYDESATDTVSVDTTVAALALLGVWCTIAALYIVAALIVLSRIAKHPKLPAGTAPERLQLSTTARVVAWVATLLPSLIGLIAATQVLFLHDDPQVGSISDLLGVWAMLNSWGLLHWGYAQLYFQRHYRSIQAGTGPIFEFPNTPSPRIVDFVYFSYTLGTSFAASDVVVLAPRGRWLVTWHSVISFFFNGLIIVFALNTILQK
jgi:uncharacterized membrane protein